MKNPVFFLVFIIMSLATRAQDYNPFTPGINRYFINDNGYLRGMRIDSIIPSGANLIYHPYRSPRGPYNGNQNSTLDSTGGSWLGKNVMRMSNGTFLFDNMWHDTVIIKTQASLGDSWIMYDDTTMLYYRATVSAIDTSTVLGTIDSVKVITVTAHNNIGQVNTDPINNLEIILSKDHGMKQAMDLYTFPYHAPNAIYDQGLDVFLDISCDNSPSSGDIIFHLIDYQSPTQRELYNWDVGDAYQYRTQLQESNFGTYNYEYDSVTAKSVNTNSTTYTIEGHKNIASQPDIYGHYHYDTYYYTYTFTLGDTYAWPLSPLPEELHQSFTTFYNETSQSYGIATPSYNILYNGIQGAQYMTGLCCYFPSINEYKKGLGRTRMRVVDGEPRITDTALIYYRQNNMIFGQHINLGIESLNSAKGILVYPNPSSDFLFITFPLEGIKEIEAFDVYGKTIIKTSTTQKEINIDVKVLTNGIYYLRVRTDKGYLTQKILIQH